MKKDNKLPITLATIKLSAYDADSPIAKSYPGIAFFDDRRDFSMNLRQSALAVLLYFSNQSPHGLRRPVSVALIDDDTTKVISTTTVRVNIPSDEFGTTIRVDFPFAYADIERSHTYNICVRDDKSGAILGFRSFHMYDELYCGKPIIDCFSATMGGVSKPDGCAFYKSLFAEDLEYYEICFKLHADFVEIPWTMPEMEIRIHYPDGKVDSRFCEIECEDFDMDEYLVKMPFLMENRKSGICYAELVFLDTAIAGFVFNTDATPVAEAWTGEELYILDEYSLEAASKRYIELTSEEHDEEKEGLTDDDFEAALQNFINSQIDDTTSGSEETDETDSKDEDNNIDEENQSVGTEEETVDTTTLPEPTETQISPLKAIESLTGLKSVKEKLSAYEKLVMFNKRREEMGMTALSLPLHAMFLGSPGTGKTTVAKRMGLMLKRAGLLSKGHVVVKERASLMGIHYGDQEVKTLEALEEAQGGILLIDEAYQLFQPDDPKDPGRIVIESLLTALANESNRDWMLILAGYPDEMMRMFEMNPGLKSRIPDTNIYIFDDFNEAELMEIAERYLERNQFTLSEEARVSLSQRLACDYHHRDKTFGNARHVINLIQAEIIPSMAMRVMTDDNCTPDSLTQIQPTDIPTSVKSLVKQRPHQRVGFRV